MIKYIIEQEISFLLEEKRFLARIEPYVSDSNDYFIHFTNVRGDIKLQLFPLSGFDTPLGIYAYPLNNQIFELLKKGGLPFASERKFIIIFSIKPEFKDKVLTVNKNQISDEEYEQYKKQIKDFYDFEKNKRNQMKRIYDYLNSTSTKVINHFSSLDENEFLRLVERNSNLSFDEISKKIGKWIYVEEDVLGAIQFRNIRDKVTPEVIKKYYAFIVSVIQIYDKFISIFQKIFDIRNNKKRVVQFLWQEGEKVIKIILGEERLSSLNLENIYKNMLEDIEKAYVFKQNFEGNQESNLSKIMKKFDTETNLTKLWSLTRHVALEVNLEKDNKRFNLLWRNLLVRFGIYGVIDPGYGLIHKNEPEQAVFFVTKSLKTNDILENKYAAKI